MDRKTDAGEVQRLREALGQFRGRVHPALHAFRAVTEAPYQALRARIERKQRRVPPLLELSEDQTPLPMPRPPRAAAGSTDKLQSPVPLGVFAPLD
jgi:hypothetical protein